MKKMQNFNDFITLNENAEIIEKYSGFSSAMNKVIAYNKREAIASGNVTNESFRAMYHYNQDIFFSHEERESVTEFFKEFIPHVLEAAIKELDEAGYEYDETLLEQLGISEELCEGIGDTIKGWGKKISQGFSEIASDAKSVASKTGEAISNAKEYIEKEVDVIKTEVKKKGEQIIEAYKNTIGFIQKLIEAGINSVKELISNVAKMFDKLGGCVSAALKKLGCFDDEKDFLPADIKYDTKLIGDIADKGESTFLSHVIAYCSVMLGNNKDKVEKLLSEGIENISLDFDEDSLNEGIMDKIANNKVLQFILCYGKDKKVSFWKSAMISIAGSLIISLGLPVILPICGVGAAAVPTICACVRVVWSARGIFKILLNRYVNKKPGENFFNLQTCICLVLTILPQIPPFKDWIASAFNHVLHWLGIDKWIDNAEQLLGKLIKELHGKNPSVETVTKTWNETITPKKGGGWNPYNDNGGWDANRDGWIDHMKDSGVSEEGQNTFGKFLTGMKNLVSPTKVHDYIDKFIAGPAKSLAHGYFIDSQKAGANGLLAKCIKTVLAHHPEVTGGEVGADYLHGASNRVVGACNALFNCPPSVWKEIVAEYIKQGGNENDLIIKEFGSGVVKKLVKHVVTTTQPVHWLYKSLVDSFGVAFVPWLDKKKAGKFSMSFGSNTSKLPYHVVTKVELTDLKSAQSKFGNPAFDKMVSEIKDIQKVHEDYIKSLSEKRKDENILKKAWHKISDEQQDNFERNGDLSKRQVSVFYVEYKDKKSGKTSVEAGVVVDMMSLLCVDVCKFRKPRKNPYYLKGVLSRLSFKPVDKKDNDTKEWIREMLGNTTFNAVNRMYNFGVASCIIERKDKKFVPGEKSETGKELSYIGNFKPEEFCDIMNDESKTHTVAYGFLSGKYGSAVGFGGKSNKLSLKHDENTIENRRYVSADTPIKDDKEVTVRTKDGKKKKKYSEMKKYQADAYNMRRATPEEIKSGVKTMDYVEARLIPLIDDKKSKLHKALYDDKDIRALFFKKNSEDIDKGLVMSIKDYLYRAESSFSEKDETNACEKMNAYRKEHNEEELGKESYDTIKNAVELIWELKGKYSNSRKSSKKSDVQKTNESRFLKFNDFLNLND